MNNLLVLVLTKDSQLCGVNMCGIETTKITGVHSKYQKAHNNPPTVVCPELIWWVVANNFNGV